MLLVLLFHFILSHLYTPFPTFIIMNTPYTLSFLISPIHYCFCLPIFLLFTYHKLAFYVSSHSFDFQFTYLRPAIFRHKTISEGDEDEGIASPDSTSDCAMLSLRYLIRRLTSCTSVYLAAVTYNIFNQLHFNMLHSMYLAAVIFLIVCTYLSSCCINKLRSRS